MLVGQSGLVKPDPIRSAPFVRPGQHPTVYGLNYTIIYMKYRAKSDKPYLFMRQNAIKEKALKMSISLSSFV